MEVTLVSRVRIGPKACLPTEAPCGSFERGGDSNRGLDFYRVKVLNGQGRTESGWADGLQLVIPRLFCNQSGTRLLPTQK